MLKITICKSEISFSEMAWDSLHVVPNCFQAKHFYVSFKQVPFHREGLEVFLGPLTEKLAHKEGRCIHKLQREDIMWQEHCFQSTPGLLPQVLHCADFALFVVCSSRLT